MDITSLPVANSIDGSVDTFPIVTSNINTTRQISRNTFLNIASQPLGLSDTQSPTNKTFNNTNVLTIKDGSLTIQNTSSTTKQLRFSSASITAGQTRTLTAPDVSDTIVVLTASQTLTNKTLTSPTINSPTITNATISADAITGFSDSDTGNVYGVSVTNSAVTISSTLTVTGATTLSSTLGTVGQPSFQTATAPPAAGASTAGIKVSSTSNLGIFFGSGAPTFSAAQGAVYMRTDGSSTSTRLYINTTGSTTWTNVTTAA